MIKKYYKKRYILVKTKKINTVDKNNNNKIDKSNKPVINSNIKRWYYCKEKKRSLADIGIILVD